MLPRRSKKFNYKGRGLSDPTLNLELATFDLLSFADKPVRRLNRMLTLLSEGVLEASLPFMLRVSIHFPRYRMTSQG